MAAGLFLLLGGAALLLLAGSKKGNGGLKVGETPDQERALLLPATADGKWLMYRTEQRPMLTQRLKVMSLHESQSGDSQLQVLIDAGQIVPPEASGYEGAKAEFAMGYNLWVSPTLLSPVKQARWLYATLPAELPPPAWEGKLVLLASPLSDLTFPGDLVATPPAPPATPPPPPPGV